MAASRSLGVKRGERLVGRTVASQAELATQAAAAAPHSQGSGARPMQHDTRHEAQCVRGIREEG